MRLLQMALVAASTLTFVATAWAELPGNYQSLSASEKREILWQNISREPYTTLPGLADGGGFSLRELFFSGIGKAFTFPSDEIEPKRTKIIHKWGSTVKVRFEASPESQYSGLFKSGALGIARLSLAMPYEPKGDFVPGLALKLFIDGQPSKNLTVMEKLEGQGKDTNYFKASFTNILPDPQTLETKFGTWAFEGFVENAIHLGVEHVAAVESLGQAEVNPKTPYQVIFSPAPGLSIASDADDFRVELAKINPGTVLYEVYGKESSAKGSAVTKIGQVVTDSAFVTSKYQDEKLYFQHQGTELKSGYILRWIPR